MPPKRHAAVSYWIYLPGLFGSFIITSFVPLQWFGCQSAFKLLQMFLVAACFCCIYFEVSLNLKLVFETECSFDYCSYQSLEYQWHHSEIQIKSLAHSFVRTKPYTRLLYLHKISNCQFFCLTPSTSVLLCLFWHVLNVKSIQCS